jgi:hypothetical protein
MAYRKVSGGATFLPHYTAQKTAVLIFTAVKTGITSSLNVQVSFRKAAK